MNRLSCLAATAIATLTLAACAGNSATNPASPTPTPGASAAVTAVMIASPSAVGSTFQLTATARLSDSTTREVTAISTWSTSNVLIANVSATGLVTVVGAGEVEFRAIYQNVAGSLAMQLTRGFSLSGTVQEAGPDLHATSGVQLEIVGGSLSGRVASSDASGSFSFGGVTGVVALEATKAGYFPWRLSNLTVDHDMSIQVVMYPTPPTNAAGAQATARCRDGSWSWAQTVAEACTANGGILYGVCPGVLCAATRSIGAIR